LPSISAILTADPTGGSAPLTVTLTATVITSSPSSITYSFDCANPNTPNVPGATFDSLSTTVTFQCEYRDPGDYKPFVTVYQNGVFATAQKSSSVTNINGGAISVRRGIIREIPADE